MIETTITILGTLLFWLAVTGGSAFAFIHIFGFIMDKLSKKYKSLWIMLDYLNHRKEFKRWFKDEDKGKGIDWLVGWMEHKKYEGLDTLEFLNTVEHAKNLQGIHRPFIEKDLLKFAEWVLKEKRSVFLDADISQRSKENIINRLGWSSDVLD